MHKPGDWTWWPLMGVTCAEGRGLFRPPASLVLSALHHTLLPAAAGVKNLLVQVMV